MDYRHALVFFQNVTPLHIGCGQDIGVVDLPIFRERATGYPLIPGSGIRGAIRARFERSDGARAGRLFGPRVGDEGGAAGEVRYAGSVAVHDAKLLLYPVRSDRGLFVWLTCPAAVARLAREAEVFLGGGEDWSLSLGGSHDDDERFLGPARFGLDPESDSVHLEEFRFRPLDRGEEIEEDRKALAAWAGRVGRKLGRSDLAASTLVVSDRSFSHFVRHATMVVQRNALDAAKTVREGALFSLEAVPPEAVFFGFFGATSPRWRAAEAAGAAGEANDATSAPGPDEVLSELREHLVGAEANQAVFHLGGEESVGLGVTRLTWADGGVKPVGEEE